MKKLMVLLTVLFLLASTKIAYAAEPANKLCAPGFEALCGLNLGGTGGNTIVGKIVQALLILAVVLALIYLVYGGIKYITSGGDKAKVDAARSHITAAIVGLILAFAAYLILNVIAYLFGINISNLSIPKLVP